MNNDELNKFINAVIDSDEEAQKASFASFFSAKITSMINPPAVPSAELTESQRNSINEVFLDKNIELGMDNSIKLNGSKIGRIETGKYDKNVSDFNQMYFVPTDGSNPIEIPNNDIAELTKILTQKYGL